MNRIAILTNGMGHTKRGAERFTEEFFTHMKDVYDIDIFGICATPISHGIGTKCRDDFKLPWRNGKAYLESFFFGKKWYELHKDSDTRFDLIINNSGFPCSYWLSKYKEKTGTPFVARARGGREEWISRWFHPDYTVFLTKHHRDQIVKNGVNATVIPNAIDIDVYKNHKLNDGLADGLERPIFLSTSAFVSFKRNHLIIKAIKKLGFGTLVMSGDGQLRDKTIRLGETKLGKHFKYLGLIGRNDLLDWYKTADVFVNASRSEAFGVVFLESLASNLPVVTQNDDRRRDIIGNAGILVSNCSNINIFAHALSYACNQKWDKKPLEQAKKYSWDVVKRKYIDLINKIIQE